MTTTAVVKQALPKPKQATRATVRQPPLFKVVMLNDDYTPMDFVVQVLQSFFSLAHTRAVQVMLEVHTKGKAIAGVYAAEIAESRMLQVNNHSRKHQHPLLCVLEKA